MEDLNATALKLLRWDKLPFYVNYLAFIDWMRYNNRWIPCKIKFVEVTLDEEDESTYKQYTLIPDPKDLKHFTLDDFLHNQTLEHCPMKVIEATNLNTHQQHFKVPVSEMKNFLQTTVYQTLKRDPDFNITIATVDQATYHFLESCLPAKIVYFGHNFNPIAVHNEFEKRRKEEEAEGTGNYL